MTTSVGPLGLFAPPHGARDSKVNEDNVLASFAGVLAGVNQAAAKLIVPMPQADGASEGDALENADDVGTTDAEATTDGASDVSATTATTTDVASTAAAAASPNAVNSSIATLNPALQEKLARVISRMRDETGHDVQVTETYRSQSRQNALYAQGRQTAGPVVTWTQSSKHTQGRAVDVTLDGGSASADAYAALQRIANEEGLRTLGSKDPGHLELPSKNAATGQAFNDAMSVPDEPADASGPRQASIARLAKVATIEQATSESGSGRVARVATVARVASVAPIATGPVRVTRVKTETTRASTPLTSERPLLVQADGVTEAALASGNEDTLATFATGTTVTMGDATGDSHDAVALATPIADTPAATQQSATPQGQKPFEISHLDRLSDAVNASRVEDLSANAQSGANKLPTKPQMAAAAVQFRAPALGRSASNSQSSNRDRQSSDSGAGGYMQMPLGSAAPTQFSVAEVATQMTSTASQRAERIMAAQDAPARPLSQIVMSVDAGNGTTDRIQVALRGSTVSATIDAADHRAAEAMRVHSDDLVRSLTKDGVDVETVRVRSSAPTTSTAPATTVDSSQKSSDSSNNSRFSREAQWDQQRSQQRSNNERRQHQRDQRGGKES